MPCRLPAGVLCLSTLNMSSIFDGFAGVDGFVSGVRALRIIKSNLQMILNNMTYGR